MLATITKISGSLKNITRLFLSYSSNSTETNDVSFQKNSFSKNNFKTQANLHKNKYKIMQIDFQSGIVGNTCEMVICVYFLEKVVLRAFI